MADGVLTKPTRPLSFNRSFLPSFKRHTWSQEAALLHSWMGCIASNKTLLVNHRSWHLLMFPTPPPFWGQGTYRLQILTCAVARGWTKTHPLLPFEYDFDFCNWKRSLFASCCFTLLSSKNIYPTFCHRLHIFSAPSAAVEIPKSTRRADSLLLAAIKPQSLVPILASSWGFLLPFWDEKTTKMMKTHWNSMRFHEIPMELLGCFFTYVLLHLHHVQNIFTSSIVRMTTALLVWSNINKICGRNTNPSLASKHPTGPKAMLSGVGNSIFSEQ